MQIVVWSFYIIFINIRNSANQCVSSYLGCEQLTLIRERRKPRESSRAWLLAVSPLTHGHVTTSYPITEKGWLVVYLSFSEATRTQPRTLSRFFSIRAFDVIWTDIEGVSEQSTGGWLGYILAAKFRAELAIFGGLRQRAVSWGTNIFRVK